MLNASKIAGNSVHITGVACFSHNESQILAGLQYGPLSVSIAAGYFSGYKGGIINCTATGIDHAVTLVGYGVDNSSAAHKKWGADTRYWKLKNRSVGSKSVPVRGWPRTRLCAWLRAPSAWSPWAPVH